MSGSIIPPLNDDGTARRLPNDPNGYTPAEARALAEDGGHVRRTGWLSGADPVTPWHGLGALTDPVAEMEAITGAQLAKAREDAQYERDRARYWADLANERQGIIIDQDATIKRLRATIDQIQGG